MSLANRTLTAADRAAAQAQMRRVTAYRSGRGPQGNLRNFRQMGPGKFDAVHANVMTEQNDLPAMRAVETEFQHRYGRSSTAGASVFPSIAQGLAFPADPTDEIDSLLAALGG